MGETKTCNDDPKLGTIFLLILQKFKFLKKFIIIQSFIDSKIMTKKVKINIYILKQLIIKILQIFDYKFVLSC